MSVSSERSMAKRLASLSYSSSEQVTRSDRPTALSRLAPTRLWKPLPLQMIRGNPVQRAELGRERRRDGYPIIRKPFSEQDLANAVQQTTGLC
jgi:hypothetical protein